MLYIIIMISVEKASMEIMMLVNMLTTAIQMLEIICQNERNGISHILYGPPTLPLPAKRSVVPLSAISPNLKIET